LPVGPIRPTDVRGLCTEMAHRFRRALLKAVAEVASIIGAQVLRMTKQALSGYITENQGRSSQRP